MTTYIGNPPKSVYGVQDATNVIADFVTDGTQHNYRIYNDFSENHQLNFRVSSGKQTLPYLSLTCSESSTVSQYSTQYTHQVGTATPPAPAVDSDTYFTPNTTGNVLLAEGVISWDDDSLFPLFAWKTNGYTWTSSHRRTIYNGIYNNTMTGGAPTYIDIFHGQHATDPIPAGVRIVITTPQATNLVLPLEYSAPRKNILFNTDFAINQRSYTSGASLAGGEYGFDRVRGHSSIAGSTHTLANGVVTIDHTTASTNGYLVQTLESGTLEVGKQYTLSWKGTAQAVVWYAGGEVEVPQTSPYTFIATDTNEIVYWYGDGVTVSEMKLEEGTSATPWEKPDKATELARCERYYWRGHCPDADANKYAGATSTFMYAGSKSLSMRTAPTLSVITAPAYTNASTATLSARDANGFTLRVSVPSAGLYNAIGGVYEANAEI